MNKCHQGKAQEKSSLFITVFENIFCAKLKHSVNVLNAQGYATGS